MKPMETQAEPVADAPTTPGSDAYARARDAARATVAQELLTVADRRLREEGPAALSMRRLATAAGCSTMVFYSTFNDKQGLMHALAQREAERWLDAATLIADPDPSVWLDLVATALREASVDRPHHCALLFDPASGGGALARLHAAMLDAIDRVAPGARDDGVAEAVWSTWVGALAVRDHERFTRTQRGLARLWAAYVARLG